MPNGDYLVHDMTFPTDKTGKNMMDISNQTPKGSYKPTQWENSFLGYFDKRSTAMKTARAVFDPKFNQYQRQYEAIFTPYSDGRSASNVMVERAIVELYVREAMKRKTRFKVKKTVGMETGARVLQGAWDTWWTRNKIDSVILNDEYWCSCFGVSYLLTGYYQETRYVSDLEIDPETGEAVFVKKEVKKGDIFIRNLDVRNVWIDDRAKNMEEANDAIVDEYVSMDQIEIMKNDPNYRNLQYVTPKYAYANDGRSFQAITEMPSATKFVKRSLYWNEQDDEFVEVMNDSIVVRNHPIPNATHTVPLVARQYGRNLFAIPGYGLCEALAMFHSEINILRELLMDAIKRSNQEAIFIGGGLTFDSQGYFGYDNQIYSFTGGPLAGNFQQVTGSAPNQAIFTYLQQLYKDIAVYTGIDIQNVLGTPGQTAYQTGVQKEASLARIDVALMNRDAAYERLAELTMHNIQMFFPMKVIDQTSGEKRYPEIQLEGERIIDGKVVKSAQDTKYPVTPESIRGDYSMEVYTDLNAPTMNEIEKAQKLEFFSTIPNVVAAISSNPEISKAFPVGKVIADLASDYGIDVMQTERQADATRGVDDAIAMLRQIPSF
jgi:hypothetical protein